MSAAVSSKNPSVRSRETSVFQSGNSQAVRIPKEFQLHTKRVEIFREGRSIVLRPKPMTAAEALDDLPVLTEAEAEALDRALEQLDDLPPLDEPVWEVTEKVGKKTRQRA